MPSVTKSRYRANSNGKLSAYVGVDGEPSIRLLGRANFSSGTLPPASIISGYTWGVANGTPAIEDGALRMNYPSLSSGQGGIYNSLHFNVPEGIKELFIKFRAKMPNVKRGLKFCKIFGRGGGGNYANTTFTLDFAGVDDGAMLSVLFGDGDGDQIANDADQLLFLNGANPSWIGRSHNNGAVITSGGQFFDSADWGSDWHTFRLHLKYNDGTTAENEINNGEYSVNIDGVDYVVASGLFNRHYSNGNIGYVSLGDWTQGLAGGSAAFDIHFDDIFISQHGFYEGE